MADAPRAWISWPMQFVLPVKANMRFEGDTPVSRIVATFMPWLKGRRPPWLIRTGLFLYDHLGGRDILPGTRSVDLHAEASGTPLKPEFKKAFEYSDCWIEDSRLVVLNARDAASRGATILPPKAPEPPLRMPSSRRRRHCGTAP